jgi:hypothetical protein
MMNRATRILTFLAVASAIWSCSGQSTSSGSQSAAPTPAGAMTAAPHMMMMGGGAISVTIRAQNDSGENGKATLTPMGKHTKVVVTVTGEPKGADQPAHIHPGTCAALNPKPEFPLHDVVLGTSTTIVSAPLATITAKATAINIHESAANIGKYVACGDIVKP